MSFKVNKESTLEIVFFFFFIFWDHVKSEFTPRDPAQRPTWKKNLTNVRHKKKKTGYLIYKV